MKRAALFITLFFGIVVAAHALDGSGWDMGTVGTGTEGPSYSGDKTISGDLHVTGSLDVDTLPLYIGTAFSLTGAGNLDASGYATFGGVMHTTSSLDVDGLSDFGSNMHVSGSLDVDTLPLYIGTGFSLTGAGNLDASGYGSFSGLVRSLAPITSTTAATLVLTSTNSRGDWHINGDDDVIDYTLPAAAVGMSVCFHAGGFAQIVTVDVDGTDVIYLNGTALTAGNAIDSAGGAGDHICLVAFAANKWYTHNRSGTWADGGAD